MSSFSLFSKGVDCFFNSRKIDIPDKMIPTTFPAIPKIRLFKMKLVIPPAINKIPITTNITATNFKFCFPFVSASCSFKELIWSLFCLYLSILFFNVSISFSDGRVSL